MKKRVISGCGDRDRAAARDLAAEDRDHAARRAEHVAEAHGDEARRRRRRGGRAPRRSTRRAPSTGPSRSSGSTALSVETSTKRFALELDRDLGERRAWRATLLRTASIGFASISGDVLVGGRVEHDRRPVALEELRASCAGCRRRRATGSAGREAALVDELALDLEQRAPRECSTSTSRAGAEPGDLAAELGADRAAGAGDEHGLVREVRRRSTRGRPPPARGRARPRPGRAGSAGEVHVARDQLVQARQRLHRDRLAAAPSRRPCARTLARGGRDRDQHLVGPLLAQDRAAGRRSCRARGRRAGAGSACAGRRRRGRSACSRATAGAASRGRSAGRVAGADDDRPPCRGRRRRARRGRSISVRASSARAGDEREQEQEVDERDRARQARRAGRGTRSRRRGSAIDAGDGHAARRAPHVPRGHVAPPAVVEAEGDEDDELDRRSTIPIDRSNSVS